MDLLKRYWVYILGAFGILAGLFGRERSLRESAEAHLAEADYKAKDAALEQKQVDTATTIEQHRTETNAEEAKTLTPEEMEKFLKENV